MTIREQIPTFLTEMPEPALALCLTPGTVPKFAPERVGQGVTNCRLLLFGSTRDVAERTQCPPDVVGGALVVAVSTVVGRKFTIYA